MKAIADAKQFITDFTHWEYQVAIGRNDAAVSETDHVIAVVKSLKCYSETYVFGEKMHRLLDRHIGRETNDHGDRIDSLRQRKVFMIRKYKGVTFGSGITADNDTMYSCFLGNDCKGDADIYVTNYSLAEIGGKLKIVTLRIFTFQLPDAPAALKKIGWIYIPNSFELQNDLTIENPGQLLETLRLAKPDKPEWIADYNS